MIYEKGEETINILTNNLKYSKGQPMGQPHGLPLLPKDTDGLPHSQCRRPYAATGRLQAKRFGVVTRFVHDEPLHGRLARRPGKGPPDGPRLARAALRQGEATGREHPDRL